MTAETRHDTTFLMLSTATAGSWRNAAGRVASPSRPFHNQEDGRHALISAVRVSVQTPLYAVDAVQAAVEEADALKYGDYVGVSFATEGRQNFTTTSDSYWATRRERARCGVVRGARGRSIDHRRPRTALLAPPLLSRAISHANSPLRPQPLGAAHVGRALVPRRREPPDARARGHSGAAVWRRRARARACGVPLFVRGFLAVQSPAEPPPAADMRARRRGDNGSKPARPRLRSLTSSTPPSLRVWWVVVSGSRRSALGARRGAARRQRTHPYEEPVCHITRIHRTLAGPGKAHISRPQHLLRDFLSFVPRISPQVQT